VAMAEPSENHYSNVSAAIRDGDVVPFLGAGAGAGATVLAADGTTGASLPNAAELADRLARRYLYPGSDDELLRVAQYVATMRGYSRLKRTLHEIFDADFRPTRLHHFLAGLPRLLSGAPAAQRPDSFRDYQLIMTTNYDDTLERAFRAVDEPFDLVTYKAADAQYQRTRGEFLHWPLGEDPRPIGDPSDHHEALSLEGRTVIVKIHGLVVRQQRWPECESFVITEDHYIDYLSHAGLSDLVPVQILGRLTNYPLLFLGYALKDWNLRVILHSIWRERSSDVPSWAVQLEPDEFDELFWDARGIKIFDSDLDHYAEALAERLTELVAASP
jgi:SIR2-like domain